MDSNITINIVEPGSTPIEPVVPNTGLFTSGIGGAEAAVIATVALVVILAIVAAIIYYCKKKQGKVGSLLAQYKETLKHKKTTTIGLTSLALLVSIGTVAGLLKLGANAANTDEQVNEQTNGQVSEETNETATVEDGEITIELGDTPVFAYIPAIVTVTEDMPAGYTLKAYSENPTLSSDTTDKTISIIPPVNTDTNTAATSELLDNTWGLSTEEPIAYTDQIFYSLPEAKDDAIILTDSNYEETKAGDTYTVYYGVYITPDMPYGTYTGATVNYEVEPISTSATVIFDGNDKFYFNGDVAATTNVMEYTPGNNEIKYSHTPNVNDEGIQTEGEMYPLDSNETFVYEFENVDNVYVDVVKTDGDNQGCGTDDSNDYFSIWSGAYPDYTAKANWETALRLNGSDGKNVFANNGKYDGVGINVEGDAVTIAYTTSDQRRSYCQKSGYGYYAKVIGYNPNIAVAGEYESPTPNGAYRFLGWSEDKDATAPTYTSADDIERVLSLSSGSTATLYAISEPSIAITYNGNGADTTTNMDNVEQYTTNVETTSQVDLLASNFTKEGYGFAGWSTDQDAASKINNTGDDKPTIYGSNQMITVDPSTSTKLNLYAVWVPAETSVTMQTFNPNSEPYASKPNGTVIALEDERDNEVYAVAKLADGNYWMIENLRLDNEPELSTTNTHNPSLPLTNNYSEGTTSNFLSATSNDWCTDYGSAPCYDQSKLNTNNVANTTASPTFSQDFTSSAHKDFDDNIASYSNYYNWYSATAGNGKQETGSGVTVAGDICPAGWILPIGNQTDTNGSFSHLDVSMGGTSNYQSSTEASNRWRSFPNNFVYSGGWDGSSAFGRGSYGYYWSSTAYDTNNAYYLYLGSDDVAPGTNGSNKGNGYSARCVAPVE